MYVESIYMERHEANELHVKSLKLRIQYSPEQSRFVPSSSVSASATSTIGCPDPFSFHDEANPPLPDLASEPSNQNDSELLQQHSRSPLNSALNFQSLSQEWFHQRDADLPFESNSDIGEVFLVPVPSTDQDLKYAATNLRLYIRARVVRIHLNARTFYLTL